MGKQKTTFSFTDIVGLTDGIIKKSSIMRENPNSKSTRQTIGTGIYVLNAALSGDIYGGIANNRITVFGGASGVGKSFLCYNVCVQAQKQGYAIIYIDTEFAIELDQLPGYGIDISPEKFMLLRNNVIEDLKIFTTQLLDNLKEQKSEGKQIDKFLIVLDSVGQLGSRKEVEDALSGKEKADFTKAKALASYFRIINSDLGYLNIPFLVTNHTYKCLTAGHKVRLADGGIKNIEDIQIGEFVDTLEGSKEVISNVKYDNCEIIKIELETGEIIKCTPEHRFLIKSEWSHDENNSCWKMAKDLSENDNILSVEQFKKVKITSVNYEIEKQTTYDLTIKDVHHYILGSGIISHNTMDLFPQDKMKGGEGLFYSASSIAFLSKAKLKEGEVDDLDLGQSGIVVTAKMVKNRLAKPKKVKFEISFVSGCNPYIGLDFWLDENTFNQVGIAKGKMVGDKFVPGGNRWYVRHLQKHVPSADLFTSVVFTKEVLDTLRPIIQEYFKYKSITEINDINQRLLEAKGEIDDDQLFAEDLNADTLFNDED